MAGPNPSLRCVEDGSGAWRRAIGVFLTGTSLSTVNGILCYIGIPVSYVVCVICNIFTRMCLIIRPSMLFTGRRFSHFPIVHFGMSPILTFLYNFAWMNFGLSAGRRCAGISWISTDAGLMFICIFLCQLISVHCNAISNTSSIWLLTSQIPFARVSALQCNFPILSCIVSAYNFTFVCGSSLHAFESLVE